MAKHSNVGVVQYFNYICKTLVTKPDPFLSSSREDQNYFKEINQSSMNQFDTVFCYLTDPVYRKISRTSNPSVN